MKTCYIVGAGDFSGEFFPDESDFVIAADGGYATLQEKGIRCDLVVGDMDSLKEIPKDVKTVRHPVEKDETDMHLGYLEGVKRGYKNFSIYGGTGGRSDHTFANYCLLLNIKNSGHSARLYSDADVAYIVKNEAIRIYGNPKSTVSIFAFGGAAEGVSIKELYYTLERATLAPDFPLGVSNSFVTDTAKIEVQSGALLVIQEI